MRVLVIESAESGLRGLLARAGCIVDAADTGEEGFELARELDYDAILLDLDLPDMRGEAVLARLRRAGIHTAVLALADTPGSEGAVQSFNLGADDYIVRPFDPEELIARLHTAVRRARGFSQPIIRTGRLKLNLATRVLKVDGRAISLTAKEYAVLELLSLRKGAVISRPTLLDHLYGGMDEPESRTVDVHICHLRRKLAVACDGEAYIETCWGRGFMLVDPEPQTALIAA
jgi:two-component system cell cycle response regulator CtrA